MTKKANITVIGYPKILSSCQKVAKQYLESANFLYYQYIPETKGVKYISSSPDHPLAHQSKSFHHVKHDIIIVGIVTAKVVEGLDKNKVIAFRAGNKAIIKTFLKARKITDRIAFISPIEEKHDVGFFQKLTGLKIDIYYAEHIDDYRRLCAQAGRDGHSVVVSGSYTFQIAKEYGLKPIFLFSDHDICHDAYKRALEAHRYHQSLEEKISQLEIISQENQDSVIFIDNRHCITFTNRAAERKLHIQPGAITGRCIFDVFDFVKPELFQKKEPPEILGTINGEQILVQIHPVLVGSEAAGTVVIAKKIKEISAMDARIRQKMRQKGFKAKYTFQDIIGDSTALKRCKKHARLYAASDAPVLIYGATGTGKELFAQAIHNSSPRKRFPFVAINCATLPSELMESELFGYVKGAFTGASQQGKQGLIDSAHLGALFLDEVDSLSSSLQAKLLRLLQENEFIRVGGNEVIPVDIRIISACNRKPDFASKQNLLRQDLFYRLSILYLELPDLQDRKSDIPLLFKHFLQNYDQDLSGRICPLPKSVANLLSELPFEGNLRELQSIAARCACLCNRDRIGNNGYLTEIFQSCCNSRPGASKFSETRGQVPVFTADKNLSASMNEAEKLILQQAKERCNGSVKCMSERLGIGRTTLWRKMKRHGLH